MKLLFLHQNFPGQFRHLVTALAQDPANEVVALGQRKPAETGLVAPRLEYIRYQPKRTPSASTHRYLVGLESAVLAGQAVVEVLARLKQRGFAPDVVVAHPGWGESLYVREIFPAAKVVNFCEFYYHSEGADSGFDPTIPLTLDARARLRTRNSLHLLNLEQCDVAVAPTWWQKSVHPTAYQSKIEVIHEGVDTDAACPDAEATFELPDGQTLRAGQRVVTYVARKLEPYRGFPQFLQALAFLQARDPEVQALVIGADGVSYGSPPPGGGHWREQLVAQLPLDMARTHFLGAVPYQRYLRALQVSAAHVYLTYPFVLSWSMLEAMSCGCLVLGSRTAPVQEVLQDGHNGLLVDFFDTAALATRLAEVLADPAAYVAIRAAARRSVLDRYPRSAGTAAWEALLRRLTQPYTYKHPHS
ncbi:MAG: glycosyltransferase family 4 protein [Burkholderiales bacterium]|nr:glycosyltransferase family 4 protein [Burkholderiales bacterium]